MGAFTHPRKKVKKSRFILTPRCELVVGHVCGAIISQVMFMTEHVDTKTRLLL